MLTSSVRIKGERDSWWEDVTRLLSGRGIRRGNPERLATEASIKSLKRTLTATGNDSSQAMIGLAISHDGVGTKRAVTVVAYANQDPSVRETETRPPQAGGLSKRDVSTCPMRQDLRGYASSFRRAIDASLPVLRVAADKARAVIAGALSSLRHR